MTTPQVYAPRSPSILDTLGYTNRVVDAILRNNPLTDAVVSEGLVRWIGNYVSGGGPNKINFLWVGEFLPADTNLPGSPAQRGFSLVRDDSRGGVSAIAMYDANPAGGGGLKQTLFITSGDGDLLFREHRDGGWQWPEENVAMGTISNNIAQWAENGTGSYATIAEGRANIVGNRLHYRVFCATTNGATGDFQLRAEGFGGDVIGPTHSLGVNSSNVFDSSVDISASRGRTITVRWEAKRTNGVGEARSQVISVRCFTPP